MEKNYKFNVFRNDKNIDLTLFQYGWEQCVPLHSYGPAKRNHYLFHFIFSGKGFSKLHRFDRGDPSVQAGGRTGFFDLSRTGQYLLRG